MVFKLHDECKDSKRSSSGLQPCFCMARIMALDDFFQDVCGSMRILFLLSIRRLFLISASTGSEGGYITQTVKLKREPGVMVAR